MVCRIKIQGYGLANVETGLKVKPDTVFQIQSVTKQFTATAIMMLVEEGKVNVDDPVSKNLDGAPDAWKTITVRHLLTHTSGIKDFINEPTASLRLDMTEDEVCQATLPRPLNFPVGSKYAYSNTNYHLLGMIIHKLTGRTWGQFVEERICKPLGMTDTRLYNHAAVVARRAAGYKRAGRGWTNGDFIAPSILAYAGGGLLSTVEDLAKWDAALYTEKLLKRSTLEQIWTSGTLNDGSKAGYGFGWAVGEFARSPVRRARRSAYDRIQQSHRPLYRRQADGHRAGQPLRGVPAHHRAGNRVDLPARHLRSACARGTAGTRSGTATEIDEFIQDAGAGKPGPRHATAGLLASMDENDRQDIADQLKARRSFGFLSAEDIGARRIERNGTPVQTTCFYRLTTKTGETWHYRFWLTSSNEIADYSDRE